ncbi:hypothetical protein IJ096_01605 [Candidatus Saccharibacteria bacterium]|nr:hypothetical protein [Candidatus Saccharibacteria bacterium]
MPNPQKQTKSKTPQPSATPSTQKAPESQPQSTPSKKPTPPALSKQPSKKPADPPKETPNLIILGIGATLLALITTSVSLYVYHASGDIYLDRSRPGFLPDEAEAEELESQTDNYRFQDTGPTDQKTLEEYLNRIKDYQKDLSDLPDPYPASSLSDRSLGIPESTPSEPKPETNENQ